MKEELKDIAIYSIDFLESMFALKDLKVFALSAVVMFIMGFVDFFEQNVFSSMSLFLWFCVVMLADTLSAILVASNRGGGFETKKAVKAIAKWLGYTILLVIGDNLPSDSEIFLKLEKLIGVPYSITSFGVYSAIMVILVASTLKNLSLIDVFRSIPKLELFLYKYVDAYKNRPTDRLWNVLSVTKQEEIEKDLQRKDLI